MTDHMLITEPEKNASESLNSVYQVLEGPIMNTWSDIIDHARKGSAVNAGDGRGCASNSGAGDLPNLLIYDSSSQDRSTTDRPADQRNKGVPADHSATLKDGNNARVIPGIPVDGCPCDQTKQIPYGRKMPAEQGDNMMNPYGGHYENGPDHPGYRAPFPYEDVSESRGWR
jgi:hypothetical protein